MDLKSFPFAWLFGAIMFAVLLAVFLFRKAVITGGVAISSSISSWTLSPLPDGMITIAAIAGLVLIIIFAGIGKVEH